eukprot:11174811-Prorocentrum_lima.AAC.1
MLAEFLECFQKARSLPEVPKAVDLARHPMLNPKVPARRIIPVLTAVLYHTDLDACYFSLRGAAKHDAKAKLQRARQEEALKKKGRYREAGEQHVLSTSIRDHFKKTHDKEACYAIPKAALPEIIDLED